MIIETWINDTLADAAHLEIPGVILKPESKNPLKRFGIDREELKIGDISEENIDRIYRALFVYSLGFYEMMNKTLGHSRKKNNFKSAIWKVFSILLEYCCKSNYQMLVRKIQAEHREAIDLQEKEFNEQQERMFEVEKKLKQHGDDLLKEHD
jgi:hypothetical protein